MNSEQSNYSNNQTGILYNSKFNTDCPTLNKIHINNGLQNFSKSSTHDNLDLDKLKIQNLLNYVKKVINYPDYSINFHLIHSKCFTLNQLKKQIEFFESLKLLLQKKVKEISEDLLKNENNFLENFIRNYNYFKKICLKLSEILNILELQDYYKKINILEDSNINKSNSKIYLIIFSIFFDTLCFNPEIQKKLFDSFFTELKKVRNNYKDYFIIDDKNNNGVEKTKENFDIFYMNREENFNKKHNFSQLKNNDQTNCEEKSSPLVKFEKNDSISKIKLILSKKISTENNNLINLNIPENISNNPYKEKLEKIKIIFQIYTEIQHFAKILNKTNSDNFSINFTETLKEKTKEFYSEFSKKFLQKIINQENSTLNNSNSNNYQINKNPKIENLNIFDINIFNKNSVEYSFDSDQYKLTDNISKNLFLKKNISNHSPNQQIKITNYNNIDINLSYLSQAETPNFNNNILSHGNINSLDPIYFCNKSLNDTKIFSPLLPDIISNKTISPIQKQTFYYTIEDYLIEISKLLEIEENIIQKYTNKDNIIKNILDISLIENQNFISEKGLKKFIEQINLKMIKFLFLLYSKTEFTKSKFNMMLNTNLNNILFELEKNHTIINKFNKVEYVNFYFFVEEIYEMKKKFYKILDNSLNSYFRSELIIKTSLEKIVNKNFEFMEHFVKLIHDEIKIAIKNKDPSSLKEFQEKFINIFKLFNEKDLFELEYRKLLSKRLLRNSSMVKETEFEFFEILKKQSGNIYTRKIEKILNEITLSYDLNLEYSQKYSCKIKHNFSNDLSENNNNEQSLEIKENTDNQILKNNCLKKNKNYLIKQEKNIYTNNIITSSILVNNKRVDYSKIQNCENLLNLKKNSSIIDINVKVVSSDSWLLENINIKNNKRLNISEIEKNESFNLPLLLDVYIQNFSEFYFNKFKNRQLKWIHEYSYAYINMKGSNNKIYNLSASYYQMSLLCLFNKIKIKSFSFKEILEKLNIRNLINLQNFKFHVFPVLNSKILLIKNKENEDIIDLEEKDIIYFNENFDEENRNIKLLNFIVEKKEIFRQEDKKENEINQFVIEDRKFQLDALIIRILKNNKFLEFDKMKTLINEEIKTYFVPETKFIKLRLDNLIDRNFIKRSEENPIIYEYL